MSLKCSINFNRVQNVSFHRSLSAVKYIHIVLVDSQDALMPVRKGILHAGIVTHLLLCPGMFAYHPAMFYFYRFELGADFPACGMFRML